MTIHLSEQQLGLTFDSAKEPEPEGGDLGWVGVQLVAEYVALWAQVLSDSGGDLKVNSTCVQNTYCMYYIDQVCS